MNCPDCGELMDGYADWGHKDDGRIFQSEIYYCNECNVWIGVEK